MDRQALEDKVMTLLRDIEKMSDYDKRDRIVNFIVEELGKETTDFYLDRHDLNNIESQAVSNWQSSPHGKKMGGLPLSSGNIRTIMFLEAVVSCLRRYHVLDRIVKVKYDRD